MVILISGRGKRGGKLIGKKEREYTVGTFIVASHLNIHFVSSLGFAATATLWGVWSCWGGIKNKNAKEGGKKWEKVVGNGNKH